MKTVACFSVTALAALTLLPLLAACAVVEVADPSTSNSGSSGSASSGGGGDACTPAEPGTAGDFKLLAQDPYIRITAPCKVTEATTTSRRLLCPDANDALRWAQIEVTDPTALVSVPSDGPVFLHAVQGFIPFYDTDDWFELRAGSDASGPLLLAGVHAQTLTPEGDAAAGWFAPIDLTLRDLGCGESPYWACETKKPLAIEASPRGSGEASKQSLRSGETVTFGIPMAGAFEVRVSAAEQHVDHVTDPSTCLPGDQPLGRTELRVLIAAKPVSGM